MNRSSRGSSNRRRKASSLLIGSRKPGHLSIMAQALIAIAARRPYRLHLHVAVPVRRGADDTRVRTKSYQCRRFTEPLAAWLADIQLIACSTHFCIAGVADMRVVRPELPLIPV